VIVGVVVFKQRDLIGHVSYRGSSDLRSQILYRSSAVTVRQQLEYR
jgi:hypothetical protein